MNATAQRDDASVRDATELEREGDEIRADMGRTLDELERKFSPEQMMERSMSFLRENGSTLVQEIGATVRNHPLPVLLTVAGLAWLTGSIARSKASSSIRPMRQRDQRAAESFNGLVQDQPLTLGALAVAAGALIGTALPMTRYENELLAQTQDGASAQPNGGTDQPQTQSCGETPVLQEPARI